MAGKTSFKTDHPDPVVRSLERARERLGHSQKKMAKALGVPMFGRGRIQNERQAFAIGLASGAGFAYDLDLVATGPLVLQGARGYSVKSRDGQASCTTCPRRSGAQGAS